MITIQREPVSAVSSDINFPMKGRRGMKDWARTAEDKLYIPKEVFTNPTDGREARPTSTKRRQKSVAKKKKKHSGFSVAFVSFYGWLHMVKACILCGYIVDFLM